MSQTSVAIQDKEKLDSKTAIGKRILSLFPNGCNRILLVNPVQVPEEDFNNDVAVDNRYPVYPPYGLGVLSAELRRRGYETELLDLNFIVQDDLKNKEAAGNLKDFNYRQWEGILRAKLDEFKPDVIGTGCMFTITYRQMKRTTDFIKAHTPTLPVIAGGVHTSQSMELVFNDCDSVDFISLYEGNASFGDMVDFINGKCSSDKLSQMAAKVNGEIVALKERAVKDAASVNIRPFYHDLDIGKYSPARGRIGTYYWLWPEGTRASTVLSNVGCRAQCTFCSVRNFNGEGVFNRDVNNVVDELQHLKETYGISHIMWLDDDLLFNEKRAIALFNEIARRNLGITWDATNGIIASAVTEDIAGAAAASGCIGLSIGIESGNAQILRNVRKPSGLRHFYRASEILHKYPQIFLKGLLICGFPDETIGMQMETVKLGMDIQLDWYTIQPLNLIPGVEITNHALVKGIIEKKALIDGTERPFVGSTGGQIRREDKERIQAEKFEDLLAGDPSRVPARSEIKDIWFLMDYKINYERIEKLDSKIKLEMLRKLFINICDNTHKENAMGNLYFALIDAKLGHWEDAKRRIALARKFSEASAYWKVRFDVLNVFKLIGEVERMIANHDTQLQ